ncbi:hypothetical protein F4553_004974 [Allocatelliglobosispora scoriae]|uniref:Beta-galactosidase C-terminal domain-containing protein n=1 Tax=Allocatelliglobosispora scoriae TaxID=643052 RepID=A0A841BV87_9ACTN|nr:Beta-galactosidase C-terminal domain [Allocatelliglobosispora scoriae]MBB5871595.1 hypothetical protein [Allocatelliglobosispora scoriae]
MAGPTAPLASGRCFGGDDNPEQWPEHVWAVPETGPRRSGVDRVVRRSADGIDHLFLLNHRDDPAVVDASSVDLLTGAAFTGTLAGGGVAVIRLTVEER